MGQLLRSVTKIRIQNALIFLSFVLVCVSAVELEDIANVRKGSEGTDVGGHRKPKLFFVSSTSTTTTIKTTTNCYYSAGAAPEACRRKKRSFLSDHVMDHVDFQPSQVESGMDDSVSEGRQGKFLLYWLTTTTTSVTTEYTKTVTVWSVGCTPSGGVLCNAG